MKKNGKLITGISVAVVIVAALLVSIISTAGGTLDVIGKDAVESFERVLNAMNDKVTADAANAGWSLEAPDGSVRFIWSEDYSRSPLHDVMLEFDAQPFIDAGLDTSKLPETYSFYEGKLMIGTKLGNDKLTYQGNSTPLAALEQLENNYRSSIGYHMALDHYNVGLSGGNMFEWAKTLSTHTLTKENQDKDIVFVLHPKPFIEAGVDPEKVEGWVYTTVSMKMNGKTTEMYKFLKPFDLQ